MYRNNKEELAGHPDGRIREGQQGSSYGWMLSFGVFALLFVIFSVFSHNFFTVRSVLNLLIQTSTYTIVSIGSALVLIVGGIDFSLGAVVVFSGVGVVVAAVTGIPLWLSMIVAVGLGGTIGLVNGILVAKMHLPSFITTLAMSFVIYGLLGAAGAYFSSHPAHVPIPNSLGDLAGLPVFRIFSRDAAGSRTVIFPGISWIVIIMVIVATLFHLILNKTRIGRYFYLVGSNREAARFSGIKVVRVKILAFALAGSLAGIVGVLLASRMMGPPGSGSGYEMIGVICAMIGGSSLLGGRGSVVGTVIGSFILSTLSMGLTMMNTDKEYIPILLNGIVVLCAVYLDRLRSSK